MKSVLLYLKRPHVVSEFAEAVENLLQFDREHENRFNGRVLRQKCPPYPDIFRNGLTMEAFRRWPDLDQILWVDDDSGFEPEQAYALQDAVHPVDLPIVSGLYFALANGGKIRPLVTRLVDTDEGCETVWNYPRNQLVRGQAHVGMGFCAIAARPLIAWAQDNGPTWFDYMRTPKGKKLIEDSSFCRRMRSIGCEIAVHTGIKITHWKTYPVTEETFDAQTALFEKRALN